jgi:long-chain acyl-CoA synthetase
MEDKKKTYPHIDKPWMQYYGSYFTRDLPQMTILDYIKSRNDSNYEGTALTYFGKEISYGELFDYINDSSKALSSLGIGVGSRVMYLMPNIPETSYLFYGGSQLGAISDFIDPRPDSIDPKVSSKKILNMIEKEKIDQIVSLDQCYLGMIRPIENELKEMGMDNIVVTNASDSMGLSGKVNYMTEQVKFNGIKATAEKTKRMKQIQEMLKEAIVKSPLDIIDYSDLVANSRYTCINPAERDGNRIATIVHTSGTSSSQPKPIVLTHDNLNAYSEQVKYANMAMEQGDRALQILPYFAAFGLCGVVHGGFSNGCNLIQVPEFSPVNFGKLILKYKPQIVIGTPSWFMALLKDNSLKNADLAFLKMITYGGDSMDPLDEELFNRFLAQHNCLNKITKGHGMSETCGCSSYAIDDYNKPGSIGIPMPDTLYAVVKPGTTELIPFTDDKDYIEGEFLISSRCVTPGVLDDNLIVEHVTVDGIDFIRTKDLGRMDKNGVMTFLSRTDRTFTRFDGFKYRSFEIEEIIKEQPGVKYCIISPYYDEEKTGNMPLADIVLDENLDLNTIDKVSFTKMLIENKFTNNPNVSTRQIPSIVRFRKEMPLTKNSKVDFVALKNEEIDNAVCVDVNETNISVSGIEYYEYPKNKICKKIK